MKITLVSTIVALALALPCGASAATIRGDYLEARTADVYTGPCFANSEVNLTGKDAILAWHVREGAWNGVPLDGLSVLAVIKAGATLGDPHADPSPVRSLIVVDSRATAPQRAALVALARSLGGSLTAEVVRVDAAAISSTFDRARGAASVDAPGLAEVSTRAISHRDHLCGNETVYYPPLTAVSDAVPAVTLSAAFRGTGLGGTWSAPGKRSAFVGAFSR